MVIISIDYQYSFSYIGGVKTWATIIFQCSSVYKKEKKWRKNKNFILCHTLFADKYLHSKYYNERKYNTKINISIAYIQIYNV